MIFSTRPQILPSWLLEGLVDAPPIAAVQMTAEALDAAEEAQVQAEEAQAATPPSFDPSVYQDEDDTTLWNLVAATEPVEVSSIDATAEEESVPPAPLQLLSEEPIADGATIALQVPRAPKLALAVPSFALHTLPPAPETQEEIAITPPPFNGPRKAA